MKKTISMFLAAIMVLTMLFVPLNIVSAASDGYLTRYVFDFGGSDNFNYTPLVKGQESAGTVSFTPANGVGTAAVKPVYAPTNYTNDWNSGSVTYKQVEIDGTNVNALNVSFGNDGVFVPIMSNGKPFELEPGHTYTVKVSYTQDSGDTGDSWYAARGLYAATGLFDPAKASDSLKFARNYATVPFGNGIASRPVMAKVDDLLSVAAGLYTNTFTLTAPATTGSGYTYDADKNAYNAVATITSTSGGGVVGDTASIDFYNYLYFYFDHYGNSSVNFTELEITRDDYVPDWDEELEDKYVFDVEKMGYYADVPNKEGQTVLDSSLTWNYAPLSIDPGLGRAKRNVYPVYSTASTMNWGPQTWAKPATIEYEGAAYDTWRIQNSNPSVFMPLKDDGTPFELAPGHTYTVNLKYYMNSYESGNPFLQCEVGVPSDGKVVMNSSTLLLDSSIISSRIGWIYGEVGQMVEKKFTITTPSADDANYNYNASQNTYTKNIDGVDCTLYNYLYFSLTNYGKPVIDIVSLDITRDDYSAKADVNYIDNGEVLKTVNAKVGNFAVDYTPADKENMVFSGWYLDETLKTPAGATVTLTEAGLNLYAKWREIVNWSEVLDKHYTFDVAGMGYYSDTADTASSNKLEDDKAWKYSPISIDAGYDRGNRNIYPLYGTTTTMGWGPQNYGKPSTVTYDGKTYNTWQVYSSNPGMFMPLKSDGTPFEVAPGHSYTVKIKYYMTSISSDNPLLHLNVGVPSDGTFMRDSNSNVLLASKDVRFGWIYGEVGQMVEKTVTIAVPAADANYNVLDNSVIKNYDGVDYTLYNYLYFSLPNYGGPTIDIVSLEVTRDDYVAQGTIEYIDNGEVIKTETKDVGNVVLEFKPEGTADVIFAGWCLDEELTVPAGTTVSLPEEGIKLYAKWREKTNWSEELSKYYKFDMSKMGNYSDVANSDTSKNWTLAPITINAGYDRGNRNIYPTYALTSTYGWGAQAFAYKSSTTYNGKTVDAVAFTNKNPGFYMPLKDDGKPFELAPGHTYTVKYVYEVVNIVDGNPILQVSSGISADGTINIKQHDDGIYYNDISINCINNAWLTSDNGKIVEKVCTITIPADDTNYNAFDNTYSINCDGVDYTLYNYLYFNMGNYGKATVNFIDIEVSRDDNEAQLKYVIDNEGTVGKTADVLYGADVAIDYIPENTATHYFAGWYLDDEFTNEVTTATVKVLGKEFFLYAKWEEYKASSTSVTNSDYYSVVRVPYLSKKDGADVYSTQMSCKSGLQINAESDANKTTFSIPSFWGSTVLLTAKDNVSGELFRAAPNTAYKITLKFRIVSDTTDDTRDYSVSVTPASGLPATAGSPMGQYNDQIGMDKYGAMTPYFGVTADGEMLTYSGVYATGEFDTIPAIGVQLFLFQGAVVEVYELSVEMIESCVFEDGQILIDENVLNNNSYKVNFTYMLTNTPATDIGIGFKTTAADGIGYPTFIEGQNTAIYTIAANKQVGVTHTASAIFTADMYAGVINDGNGCNDTLSALNSKLYAYLTDITYNDCVIITGIDVVALGSDIITVKGGQALNAEAELKENCQAIRYSFGYNSKFGDTIIIDGVSYKVKERGFIYANGNNYANKSGDNLVYTGDMNVTSAKDNSKYVVTGKTTGLTQCWAVEDVAGQPYYEIQFSTYVTNFAKDDTRELLAKAYLVLEMGGQNFTVYSDFVNRSVSYIKSINDANIDPSQRQLVWGYDFSKIEDISEVTSFHQNNNRNNFTQDAVKNPVIGGDNYVIEDGALKLKITYSDTETTGAKYDMPVTLTTKDRMSFKYGYLELEATLPYERGIHQGYWLAPQDEFVNGGAYVKQNAEVDIFEVDGIYDPYTPSNTLNPRGVIVSNLHKWYHYYGADGNQLTGTSNLGMFRYSSAIASVGKPFGDYSVGSSAYTDDSRYTQFNELSTARQKHKYGFEWNPEYMAFYIDGVEYFRTYIDDENYFYTSTAGHENSKSNKCFHEEQYILFSFCPIGESNSNFGGDFNNAALDANDIIALAAERQGGKSIDFTIHSIKLYQRLDGSETLTVK